MDADATLRLLTGEKVPQPRNRRQSIRNIATPAPATAPAAAPGPETA
jgi:hypothetical protein